MTEGFEFSDAVIERIANALKLRSLIDHVHLRHLDKADGSRSVGLELEEWLPIEYEIDGNDFESAAIASYTFNIEYFVKTTDKIDGQRLNRTASKDIRLMLERDPDLRVALRQLTERGEDGRVERFLQMPRVSGQRFGDGLIDGQFNYLSATTFTIVTETI